VLIDPNYLSVPDDRTAFQRAIHWSREFFHRASWQDLFEEELMPGPKRASDEALLAHIERFATTLYHYTGTCAMGLDRQAPVDPEFRLRGIERLRVCDASVFPVIPGSNPQTTIMMMAMRLAALLLEE
jgi:choline dehydrogenase